MTCFLLGGGANAADWAAARTGYEFQFPRDHGPHPGHKIEWWYFTGNLKDAKGGEFGYQLTFFRIGIMPEPATASPWAVRDVWMAHFALTDAGRQRYFCADRLNRAGPGLAGATMERIWNEDWECARAGAHDFTLRAEDSAMRIELIVKSRRAPVIHGEGGISQKGAMAGNASHYYSLTHLETEGVVTIKGEPVQVKGTSWMDHEFGTSFLEKGQRGWDWFSGRLDDGSALMLFQLRGVDAAMPDAAAGTFIAPDGAVKRLRAGDFRLEPGREWTSPPPVARYPTRWRIDAPGVGLALEGAAVLPGQEFRAAMTPGLHYWEGAVRYQGVRNGRVVKGEGYLEMTGYGGSSMAEWFGVGN